MGFALTGALPATAGFVPLDLIAAGLVLVDATLAATGAATGFAVFATALGASVFDGGLVE